MRHDINYDVLLENTQIMINLLEFDSMRSSGKLKLNSQHLHSLYYLKEQYESMVKKPTPTKKKEG